MSIPVFQVATFTGEPFGGNPAFVVAFDGESPETAMLQLICEQLDQKMIAVVERRSGGLRLITVTPHGLHPGAGHATHAAAWVAYHRLVAGATAVEFGIGNGGVRRTRKEGHLISIEWPTMPFAAADRSTELSDSLGRAPVATFDSSFGVVAVFLTEEEVATLSPDLTKLAGLDCRTVIVTAPGNSADFVIRVFAPKEGLPEDPVCGTAHRILTPLWSDRFGRKKLVSHQLSKRRGELFCELAGNTVTISGRAALALEGVLALHG